MPGTFLGDIPVVVPLPADWALGSDGSDGNDGKLFTVPKLLSVMTDNWAEIRSNLTVGHISSSQDYDFTTRHVAEFSVNNAMSKAAAGDADAGTVLTADAANNKIIIPPNTRVWVQWQKLIVPASTPRSTGQEAPVSWLGVCDVDGVANSDTGGGTYGASHSDPAGTTWVNLPVAVTGSGIVENATASAVDMQLFFANGVSGEATVGVVTWIGFLRAIWMGDLS